MNVHKNTRISKHGQALQFFPLYLPVELVTAVKCQAAVARTSAAALLRKSIAVGLPLVTLTLSDGEEDTPNEL